MNRNIVVFSDGTGNSAANAFKTNVWRLYQALDLTGADQIAVFDDGVGTSAFKPLRYLGLALGVGVKRNVIELYKFLCRNYVPGDRIYGFGFSRGAFTIRVLNGLINSQGLISFASEEELKRNAVAAYRAHRKVAFHRPRPWGRALRWARDTAIHYWNRATGTRTYAEISEQTQREGRGREQIPVHFLGLWDTVAAYGLPIDELTHAVDRWIWPMTFAETDLPPHVTWARQALSLDEARRTFLPIPWTEKAARSSPTEPLDDTRLLQVWFAGVHADVGGGYPDDGLAHVPLNWMIGEAAKKGLRFQHWVVEGYAAIASDDGRIYDSRAGFGVFYRYHPRDVAQLMGAGIVPLVHDSVPLRMAFGNDAYAPISLPEKVDVLAPDGRALPFTTAPGAAVSGGLPTRMKRLQNAIILLGGGSTPAQRRQHLELALDTVWWRRLLYFVTLALCLVAVAYPLIGGALQIAVIDRIDMAAESTIKSLVSFVQPFLPSIAGPWLASIADHPTLATTLGAGIALCLWLSGFLQVRIHDRARAAWNVHVRKDSIRLISRLRDARRRSIQLLAFALGFAAVAAFTAGSSQPWLVVLQVILVLATLLCIGWQIYFAHWTQPAVASVLPNTLPLRFARRLRTNGPLLKVYRTIAESILPPATLLVCAALLIVLTERAAFDVRSVLGNICQSRTREAGLATVDSSHAVWISPQPFPTNAACWASGAKLIAGGRYRLRLVMPPDRDWFDRHVATDIEGFAGNDIAHLLDIPAKRWWTQNWFKPIARIGDQGNDEYVLDSIVPLPTQGSVASPALLRAALHSDKPGRFAPILDEPAKRATEAIGRDAMRRTLVAEFTARRTGELFLYVNDSVPLWWPWSSDQFYRNNSGTADVTVQLVKPPPPP
jgi:uncharacterized protein (DUF2235 family)